MESADSSESDEALGSHHIRAPYLPRALANTTCLIHNSSRACERSFLCSGLRVVRLPATARLLKARLPHAANELLKELIFQQNAHALNSLHALSFDRIQRASVV